MRLILKILAAPPGGCPDPVRLDLYHPFVLHRHGPGTGCLWWWPFLGMAVLVTYSLQNGIILLVIAFLISPMGLPTAAAWLLGKVQGLRYAIQDRIYR